MADHTSHVARPARPTTTSGHDLGSPSPAMSSSSAESDDGEDHGSARGRAVDQLRRPGMGPRMSSGTIIVPRDAADVEVVEDYGPEDARTMSPRRTSEEVDRLGESAREALKQ
jgi:hypothetical protein